MKAKKGMTLIEIVVSMGVYAIIALLVVRIMSTVNAVMRSTNQLNDRLSYEAKFADNVQTNDDASHAFDVVRVDYEIIYDIKTAADGSTNGKRINSGGTERAAFEYTVDAVNSNAQIIGEVLHSNVNYRFMTFNKVPVASPERPTTPFRVVLRPVAYFSGKYSKTPGDTGYSDKMEKQFDENMTETERTAAVTSANAVISKFDRITATGTNFSDGSGSKVIIDKSDEAKKMALNADYEVLVNPVTEAEVLAGDTVSKLISFTAVKNGANYSTGSATYYMYVKYGSEDTSIVFYNQVVIEYNVNTGALNPLKSE